MGISIDLMWYLYFICEGINVVLVTLQGINGFDKSRIGKLFAYSGITYFVANATGHCLDLQQKGELYIISIFAACLLFYLTCMIIYNVRNYGGGGNL